MLDESAVPIIATRVAAWDEVYFATLAALSQQYVNPSGILPDHLLPHPRRTRVVITAAGCLIFVYKPAQRTGTEPQAPDFGTSRALGNAPPPFCPRESQRGRGPPPGVKVSGMTPKENPTVFDRFAWSTANFVSRAPFFAFCMALVIVWAPSYPCGRCSTSERCRPHRAGSGPR